MNDHARFLISLFKLNAIVLSCGLLMPDVILAQIVVKSATGDNLADGASWEGGIAPTATDIATWEGASLGGPLTIGAPQSWQGINILGATDNLTTSGSSLTLGAGGISITGRSLELANSTVFGSDATLTLNTNNQGINFSGGANLGGNTLTIVSGFENRSISGSMSNGTLLFNSGPHNGHVQFNAVTTGAFTLLGTGSANIILNSADASNAALNVNLTDSSLFRLAAPFNDGELLIGNLTGTAGTGIRANFGPGPAVRTLHVNQTVNGTFAGNIIDAGNRLIGLTKSGSATLSLTSSSNAYTGQTFVLGGTLRIGEGGRLNNGNYASDIVIANSTLHFDSTANQIIGSEIIGNGSLLKSNSGTLTLSGNTSGFIGTTTVSGGRLVLDTSLGGAVVVNDGGQIAGTGSSNGSLTTSAGAGIVLEGGAVTAATSFNGVTFGGQTFLEFSSTPVNNTVYDVVNYGAAGLTGLGNLGALARGTINHDNANNKVTFTAGEAGTRTWNIGDGVWNRFGQLQNWAEGDQVFYNGDTVIFGDIASDTTIEIDGIVSPGGSAMTISNSANTYTFGGTGTISGTAGIDKSGDGTVVFATDNSNSGPINISAGTLQVGNGGDTGSIGSGDISNDGQLVIDRIGNVDMSNSISGTGSLVKNGDGNLVLTGSNTYEGGTTLNAGTIRVGNNTALGTGAVTLNSGNVTSNSGATRTLDNDLDINGDISLGDSVGTGQLVFNGSVDLQGGNRVINSSLGVQGARFNGVISDGGITKEGIGRITLTNDDNTFTGPVVINEGILATSTLALANSQSVTINAGADPNAEHGLALGSNGTTIINNLSGDAGSVIRTNFNIGANGERTLQANQSSDLTFAGTFVQGANREISLIKEGAGNFTLTGDYSYTGTTTVNQGDLIVNGTHSSAGAYTVNGNAGLKGIGVIEAEVFVNSGGSLSPGNSVGALTIAALTMESGSNFVFEADAGHSELADLLKVDGELDLDDVVLSVSGLDSIWSLGTKLTLISYNDAGLGITSGFAGYDNDMVYTFGGSNPWLLRYDDTTPGVNFFAQATAGGATHFVTITAVPEPSSVLVLGAFGLLAATLRRRR